MARAEKSSQTQTKEGTGVLPTLLSSRPSWLIWLFSALICLVVMTLASTLNGNSDPQLLQSFVLKSLLLIGGSLTLRWCIRAQSPWAFTTFLVYLMLSLGMLLSKGTEGSPGFGSWSLPESVIFSFILLMGAGTAHNLHRRNSVGSLKTHTTKRLESRASVDTLVRLSLPAESNKEQEVICVVIRDISRSGMGLSGFPDELTKLSQALSSVEGGELEVTLSGTRYRFTAKSRWWKSARSHSASCGISLDSSADSERLRAALIERSERNRSPVLAHLFGDHNDNVGAQLMLWSFTLLSVVFLGM